MRKLIEHFSKKVVKAMLALTVFEILLFVGRSVLSPAQWGTRGKNVEVLVKNQKNFRILLKLLDKLLADKLIEVSNDFYIYLFIYDFV